MVGVTLNLTFSDEEVLAVLGRLAAGMEDMSEPMDEIGAALETTTVERFTTNIDPDGVPWIPSIRVIEEGGSTLLKSGHLRDTITHQAGPRSVQVGTNVVYGAIHQLGGQAGRGGTVTLVPRPYLGVSEDDEDEMVAILASYISTLAPIEGNPGLPGGAQ